MSQAFGDRARNARSLQPDFTLSIIGPLRYRSDRTSIQRQSSVSCQSQLLRLLQFAGLARLHREGNEVLGSYAAANVASPWPAHESIWLPFGGHQQEYVHIDRRVTLLLPRIESETGDDLSVSIPDLPLRLCANEIDLNGWLLAGHVRLVPNSHSNPRLPLGASHVELRSFAGLTQNDGRGSDNQGGRSCSCKS
jgi:hypothetical protein